MGILLYHFAFPSLLSRIRELQPNLAFCLLLYQNSPICRINIPMAKERCVPQRRCNHVVPAEVMWAYEIGHWAEGLAPGWRVAPLLCLPQLYPARQLE